MKKYFLKAIVPAIAFTVIYFLIDIVIGNNHLFFRLCNTGYHFHSSFRAG